MLTSHNVSYTALPLHIRYVAARFLLVIISYPFNLRLHQGPPAHPLKGPPSPSPYSDCPESWANLQESITSPHIYSADMWHYGIR